MFRSPGDCDLKLLDLEEDRDVGLEVARRVGGLGPVRVGLNPGGDLVGSTIVIFLTFFRRMSSQYPRNVAFERRKFRHSRRRDVAQDHDLLALRATARWARSWARMAGGNTTESAGRSRSSRSSSCSPRERRQPTVPWPVIDESSFTPLLRFANPSSFDSRILDRVVWSVGNEVPRNLLRDDLEECVLEGRTGCCRYRSATDHGSGRCVSAYSS